MTAASIGVFGGTFNPIHFGHLRSALELRERLGIDEIRFMPSAQPPHRPAPSCAAQLRAELVRLAIQHEAGFRCDERELARSGPSYTIDSLLELRAEQGSATSVSLIMGADALAGLASWHRWRELLDVAHIVVIARPGWSVPASGEISRWLQLHLTEDVAQLLVTARGAVLLQRLRPLDISSTEIRHMLEQQKSPRYLLPDAVWQRIQAEGLYGYGAT